MQTTLTRRKRNEWNIMENKRESSKTKKKNILFSMMFFLRARFVFFAYNISTFFRIHLNGTNKERKMIGNWQKIWTRGIVQRYSMRVNSWALGQAVTSFGLCYVLIGDWQHSNENGNKNGVREREREKVRVILWGNYHKQISNIDRLVSCHPLQGIPNRKIKLLITKWF